MVYCGNFLFQYSSFHTRTPFLRKVLDDFVPQCSQQLRKWPMVLENPATISRATWSRRVLQHHLPIMKHAVSSASGSEHGSEPVVWEHDRLRLQATTLAHGHGRIEGRNCRRIQGSSRTLAHRTLLFYSLPLEDRRLPEYRKFAGR